MIAVLKRLSDSLLGRGEAACTVPVLDGVLRPNNALDEAMRLANVPDAGDMVGDGSRLLVSSGRRLLEIGPAQTGQAREILETKAPISALATQGGTMAVAEGGTHITLLGGAHDGRSWSSACGKPFVCVNALAFDGNRLIICDASRHNGPDAWQRDLMEKRSGGRIVAIDLASSGETLLADGLAHPFGLLACDGAVICSESWRHRVLRLSPGKAPHVLADNLPGYPSRLAQSADGGFWLTVFACRTQLVEFVLRERKYREVMMATIAPEYWPAPQLRPPHSFLEPLQGATVFAYSL
ncbi:MAG: hypothetical protein KDJ73_15300, partial [Notoacmeibacter sp.]|nr:hypothetical protein [Notoacmeibacter sp.]